MMMISRNFFKRAAPQLLLLNKKFNVFFNDSHGSSSCMTIKSVTKSAATLDSLNGNHHNFVSNGTTLIKSGSNPSSQVAASNGNGANSSSSSSSAATSSSSSRNSFKWLAEKVGTDLKEVRLNFNYFRQNAVNIPFALIQINDDAFENKLFVKNLAESLAFLNQNGMDILIVIGDKIDNKFDLNDAYLSARKEKFESRMIELMLEFCNFELKALPIFNGDKLYKCKSISSPATSKNIGRIIEVNKELIQYCFKTNQIPIINSMGHTPNNHLTCLDINHVTNSLASKFNPFKIINLNLNGGLRDSSSKVILNINIPNHSENIDPNYEKVSFDHAQVTFDEIRKLLLSMPRYTSYIITRIEDMIAELFTNVGRGTFFKISERIIVTDKLDDINLVKLKDLIEQSFGKKLRDDYFEKLRERKPLIYITENYSAAAIITVDLDNYAYLDKLCVAEQYQGHGLSDLVWERIKTNHKNLFWRSRKTNAINSWYFRHAQGSWQSSQWIFFWYGLENPNLSSRIIDYARNLEISFVVHRGEENNVIN